MAQPTYPTIPSAMPLPPALPQAPVNIEAPYHLNDHGQPTQMAWPNNLVGAFAHRRRVTKPPHLSRDEDPTIDIVAANQESYIRDMIQAVFTTDGIEDNPTFRGLYLFHRGDAKQASGYDVEAACRILFSAILNRCLVGYCGSRASNRLINSGNKFEGVDQVGNCQQRIDNVIKTLREWKSVCKEILTSDSKIDALANAPATVWRDKMDQKVNNLTKKASTQNDRKAAANAKLDASPASQVASGDLPPVVPAVRRSKLNSKKKNTAGKKQTAAATTSQDQSGSSSPSTAPPSYGSSDNGGYNPSTGNADLVGWPAPALPMPPMYASAAPHGQLMNCPSFNFTNRSGAPPQNQQDRSFMSGYLEQAHPTPAFPPPPVNFPHAALWGFGAAGHGFSLGASSLTPTMGSLGAAPASVNNYHLFGGSNAQYHFNDVDWSPNHVFSPPGNTVSNGPYHASADVATSTYPMMPSYRGPEEVVPIGPSDRTSEVHHGGLPPKMTAKHARTATMDAQAQPVSTRVKRNQAEDEVAEGLDELAE